MSKLINLIIISSFAGLWVATLFSKLTELILGFFLILTFGIIHGSNDILLLHKVNSPTDQGSTIKSLITYIFVVLCTFLAFYGIPTLTLIVFIIFSAYHFGEQHWEDKVNIPQKWLLFLYQTSYGLLILSILFTLNISEVINIVRVITDHTLSPTIFNTLLFCSIAFFSLSLLVILYLEPIVRNILLQELFFLGLLSLIFKVSSLIWGFTIYFVLWHSLPSLYEQVQFIYGKVAFKEILAYIKNAIPYWVVSIIGIIISYIWFKDSILFYGVFFSFIAAVTFPHAIIITKMFKQKKNNNPNKII